FDLLPPDVSRFTSLIQPALDTIYMSFVAMILSAMLAFFLSFLAAYNVTPHPLLQYAVRGLASFLQSIPALVWVLVFVAAYGLGSIAGTIALVLSGTGLLTRSFAEMLEEIDMGPVEAIRSTGGNWVQVMGQAVVPQVLPGMIGWSLYKFDLNIREAAVIGMVGGGGIGFAMQKSLKLFQYKEACMAIVIIFVLIMCIEYFTNRYLLFIHTLIVFGLFFLFSLWQLSIDYRSLITGTAQLIEFVGHMLPPDVSTWKTVVVAGVESLQIAFVGTSLGIGMALCF